MPIITKQDVTTREGSAPGLEVSDLVDAAQGSQSLTMGELTIAPNMRVPRHIHPNTEEAMLILEGTLEVVLAPAGTVHGFLNRTQEPARLLCTAFSTVRKNQPDYCLSSRPSRWSGCS